MVELLKAQQAECRSLIKQLAEKDRQIAMVLESKFESRAVQTQDAPTPSMGGILPPESLMDVISVEDDRAFIDAVSN